MEITSSAFTDSQTIPAQFSCDGDGGNPALQWSGVPTGTKSLCLIMEDPDVPRNLRPDGLFIHWMVWNIPPTTSGVAENAEPNGVVGMNTSGQLGYRPPCPPHGSHRYYFRLYALDTELILATTATKADLLQAMEGHVLQQAVLMGRYARASD
ncbi:MAG: YbhB/YbcL family Raf kinase inhibitor-like protein [Candidatus Kerfeldbacteria bacterium]|nr:YbhB/YbcL family Raf kinase inhibitor-like protein [Candidatus Kerfeldbacteria bacterium]